MQPTDLYKGSTIYISFAFTPVGGITPSLVGITPTAAMKKPDGTTEVLAITNLVSAAGTFDIFRQTTDLSIGRYRIVVTLESSLVYEVQDPLYIQLIEPL